MDIAKTLSRIKHKPGFDAVGMVLCHNGVVRGTSRDGRPVSGLRVEVDHPRLARILKENRATAGIFDIQVEIAEGRDLDVGEDVMVLVVAGDIRETVIRTLEKTLEGIKTTVTRKTEYFTEDGPS
jgi:molybdopterin synthase catalytic subunit